MSKQVIGAKVVNVRVMTKAEMEDQGWEATRSNEGYAMVLDNGVTLYASQDFEGNGPGVFFGKAKNGDFFALS
jgi:hypothetical protein